MKQTMELATWSPLKRTLRPPPLWLVTSGDVTVGPVTTTALVRGVLAGLVWDNHYVRDTRTSHWRPVRSVREVRALDDRLFKRAPRDRSAAGTLETLVKLSDDRREVLKLGLELAARRTGAMTGLVHTFDDPMQPPVARLSHRSGFQLGRRMEASDPVQKIAKARCIAIGAPDRVGELRQAAGRLGGGAEVKGVAMIPIACSGGVLGIMELGRSDHPFRDGDVNVLRGVMQSVVGRLDALS